MTPSQLTQYLDTIFKKKVKHSTFIWGDHGVGKSTMVKAAASKHGYKVIDFRISQVEAIDVAGMYYPVESSGETSIKNLSPTYFLDMVDSAIKNNGESKICLFFDEHNMGRRETMNATFEQILDRRVKGKKMPEDVIIICAGNPETDKYDTTTMSESLKDRLIHVYATADQRDWLNWANSNNIHPDVVAFGASGLMDFKDSGFRVNLEPSSRSLARLSDILNLGLPQDVEDEVILGILGKEKGIAFIKNRVSEEKAFTAEDMLTFTADSPKFKKYKQYCNTENTRLDILSVSMDNFAAFVYENNIDLTDEQVDSIALFMHETPGELLFKFWDDIDKNYEKSYKSIKTLESFTKPLMTGRHQDLYQKLLVIKEAAESRQNSTEK